MPNRTTSSSPWRRAVITLTATSAALAAVTVPATAATARDHKPGAFTITIEGGNAFPESVATDSDYVYTGSIDDGTVYRGRLGAKTLEPLLPGGKDSRTQVTGIKTTEPTGACRSPTSCRTTKPEHPTATASSPVPTAGP